MIIDFSLLLVPVFYSQVRRISMRAEECESMAKADTVDRRDAPVLSMPKGVPNPALQSAPEKMPALPEPPFPQFPQLLGDVQPTPQFLPSAAKPYRTRITPFILRRALRGWLYPYIRSRVALGDFHPIMAYFKYLNIKQYVCGFSVFFNINITRINIEDVKQLTQIARDTGIATDYHINESPMLDQPHFKHSNANSTFITEEDWPRVDGLIDWLIEKNRSGCKMVNSVRRLRQMKDFMRGKLKEWDCGAEQNSLVIRTDGTLTPCFPLYSTLHDWCAIRNPRFNPAALQELKCRCQPRCFSTLNHNLAYCYKTGRVIKWLLKQTANGFRGTTGSFD
jgi:hypothetical protein